MTGYGKTLSSVRVIDENQVDVSAPFACSVSILPVRIIFRIPPVPMNYHQVSSFSNWLTNRRPELTAYVNRQNQCCAEYSIQFEVQKGSRHDILRAIREIVATQPSRVQTTWLVKLRSLVAQCVSSLRTRHFGVSVYTRQKHSAA